MPPRVRASVALLSTVLLAAAPAEGEVLPPRGVPVTRPDGVMIAIHGGAWMVTGPAAVAQMRPAAERYARQGWVVHNIDYAAGHRAFGAVLRHYDRLAARYESARLPICAYGQSAGGHLALMLAEARPSLDCVIDDAGPTDLLDYPVDATAVPLRFIIDNRIAPYHDLRGAWSPARHGAKLQVPAILNYARADPIVPLAQGRAMAAAAPAQTTVSALRPGSAGFVHSDVHAGDLAAARAAERRLLARLAVR